MRIIGHVPHPVFKITLLEHNDRYTIQVEAGPYSQHFRFRKMSGLEDPTALASLVDEPFLEEVKGVFDSMHKVLWERLNGMSK